MEMLTARAEARAITNKEKMGIFIFLTPKGGAPG
jgi:hypothetical protein